MKTHTNSAKADLIRRNVIKNHNKFGFKLQLILLLTFLVSNSGILLAQATEKEVAKEFYKADANINLIINYLPSGWKFSADSGNFFITYKDSLAVVNTNEIKINKENQGTNLTKKILPQIIFKYEKKWDFYEIQEASLKNDAVREDLRKLQGKYKIKELIDTNASAKTEVKYITKNDSEKKRLDNYLKDLKRLENKIKTIPNYNTKNYSLFLITTTGLEEKYTPEVTVKIPKDIRRILVLFREVCGQ